MPRRCLGIVANTEKVIYVDAEIPDDGDAAVTILGDATWRLQKGSRPEAYSTLFDQVSDYVRENHIDAVIVKASAASQRAVKLGHFHSAEVRGVAMAAAASVCDNTTEMGASWISRTYGDRKLEEYIKDDAFWAQMAGGVQLRNGSREAAMLIIAQRNSQ